VVIIHHGESVACIIHTYIKQSSYPPDAQSYRIANHNHTYNLIQYLYSHTTNTTPFVIRQKNLPLASPPQPVHRDLPIERRLRRTIDHWGRPVRPVPVLLVFYSYRQMGPLIISLVVNGKKGLLETCSST